MALRRSSPLSTSEEVVELGHADSSGHPRRQLRFQGDSSDGEGMRKRPSPWSIIWTDNACCGIVTAAPLILFIAVMIKITYAIPGRRGGPDTPIDPAVASLVLACAVALILFLFAIVARRVERITSLFEAGREVEASVRKLTCFRGGAKLELEFELDGIPYQVDFRFLRGWRTPAFSEGTRIPVLLDPANPKRVVPLALYGDPFAARTS